MKKHNLETGRLGEEAAGKYLEKKGYKLLEQNYKTKYGETDLIAKTGKELVFVEVRTKKGETFGSPEESLDKKKLRRLWLNAQSYINRTKWLGPYRIDAVCIVLNKNNSIARLSHYENVS